MIFRIYYTIMSLLIFVFAKFKVVGAEQVPDGPALICGNHTSMMDPVYIAVGMYYKIRQYPKFVAKAELAKVPVISTLIRPLVVFLDRGKSDLAAIRTILSALQGGNKVLIFPEGTRVKEGQTVQPKTGVSLLSLKTGAPIVPVYITSGLKPLWRFPKVEVRFGKPYLPEKAPGLSLSENYRAIAEDLMIRIAELQKDREGTP